MVTHMTIGVFRFGALQDVIRRYQFDGDIETAYDQLVSGNWARTFLIGKHKGTVTSFKEHVSHNFTIAHTTLLPSHTHTHSFYATFTCMITMLATR